MAAAFGLVLVDALYRFFAIKKTAGAVFLVLG
jgi:hypothetical protein